jgi:hypothetical protein
MTKELVKDEGENLTPNQKKVDEPAKAQSNPKNTEQDRWKKGVQSSLLSSLVPYEASSS